MYTAINKYLTNITCNFNADTTALKRNFYPNLAPLEKDTVSFSGRAPLHAENMADAPKKSMCKSISDNAEPARYYLETVLNKYLSPLSEESSEVSTKDYPVLKYTTRVKTPNSISEKVISKYSKIHDEETDSFSDIAVDEFLKYFQLTPGTTKEDLIKDAQRITKYSYKSNNFPPFENSEYYISLIIETYKSLNRLNFNSYNINKIMQIFEDINENIKDKAPKRDEECKYAPDSTTGVKYYANDIVGARIIMKESNPAYTAVVINALKKAVNDGVLKIDSIENNVPDTKKIPKGKEYSDYIYAYDKDLKSLAKASGAKLQKNNSKSGYLAVHINVDLSNPIFNSYAGVHNGYKGEIQIIGVDVLQLKEVEDLCYKLKDEKNAINAAYKPFKNYFLKYYTDETKEAFDEYTYALYLAQRAIPAGNSQYRYFPGIKELGFEGRVPQELDFNILKEKKRICDEALNAINIQHELDDKEKMKDNRLMLKFIQKNGNIDTLKKQIAFAMK